MPPTVQAAPAPGDFVVTDQLNETLFGVTPAGVVTVIADGPPLDRPIGVAIDADGDFIVADTNAGSLFRVTPSGVVSTIATGLGSISGVAIDGAGDFITLSCSPGSVIRVTPGGVVTIVASGPPLSCPNYDPAIDSAGDIIVTDSYANALFRVTPNGVVSTIASGPPFILPNGVVIDEGGDFIVLDDGEADYGAIFRVTAGGSVTKIDLSWNFLNPRGIDIDGGGNFVVPEAALDTLFRVTPSGLVTIIAESPLFGSLSGVAVVPFDCANSTELSLDPALVLKVNTCTNAGAGYFWVVRFYLSGGGFVDLVQTPLPEDFSGNLPTTHVPTDPPVAAICSFLIDLAGGAPSYDCEVPSIDSDGDRLLDSVEANYRRNVLRQDPHRGGL